MKNCLRTTRICVLLHLKIVPSPKSRVDGSRPFQTALDQVQISSVEPLSNNNLAISTKQQQQLKSNPSWINSILSFPGELLFGQMAYADEMPQSSDDASSSNRIPQPEGTWSIFKRARDGDPNAQLEMRRRFPIFAQASDGINNAYRAWNDPILGFKNSVHNRLGASWFLPGSMDDLGEVCLNSATAIAGVSTIPKVVEGYRKVQLAYQAYKTVQSRGTLSSNRFTMLSEGLSKSSAKELISSGKLNLPKLQSDKIMKIIKEAPGGANAKIKIKQVNQNGNVRVVTERPGYDGFQRFSFEVDAKGNKISVVQTAYDKQGNIVQQKPGQPKNNIFDVKLPKPKAE